METTLDVEWASSMAPGARVLVYAGSDAISTTLLRIYDRIVTDNRAAVLTTSWGRCETDYPRSYLAVDAVLLRAAAQGITVIAASGDTAGLRLRRRHAGRQLPRLASLCAGCRRHRAHRARERLR